jgi:predicted nucleotidyltransferase
MSISIWFETFNKNLRMSTDTVDKISYRYKRITKQLNNDFWDSESDTLHSLYVGSYGRGTEIHTSDIDMIMQLRYETYVQYNAYTNNGQSALLQAVKTSIEKTYKPTYIRADGQVIKLDFNDGINFEIVPAFINKDGSYTFPDSNNGGSWRTTNPKPEIDEMTKANNNCNKNLKKLCRMGRAWKETLDVPIGGLLIDTLAYNFLNDYQHKDKSYLYFDFMSRDFFAYMRDQKADQQYWLAVGSNQYVYTKGNFQYKALRCYNISLEAIAKEKDYPTTAKSKWREIYGTKFPS